VLAVLADGTDRRDQDQACQLRGRFADSWDGLKRIGDLAESRSHASSGDANLDTGDLSHLANGRRRGSDAYLGRPCFALVFQRGRPVHAGRRSASPDEIHASSTLVSGPPQKDQVNGSKDRALPRRPAGYECRDAAGGWEALALLKSGEHFDLVLADLMMDDLDGIGLLEGVKDKYPDIPVVIVTAVHDISVVLAAIRNVLTTT
jgi:hypothetical protein